MKSAFALAIASAMMLTACGEVDSGSDAVPDETGMESFAFSLTTESSDGDGERVETTQGVVDPATGRSSAVRTTPGGKERMLMVDDTMYIDLVDSVVDESDGFGAPSPGSCLAKTWTSTDVGSLDSGALVDTTDPTGLDIEQLQEMVTTRSPELRPLSEEPDASEYSVELEENKQDEYRQLLDMVVRVDGAGRIVAVDWTVSVEWTDSTGAAEAAENASTETMSLTLTDFGTPVDVEAPDAENTCDSAELSLDFACGFGAGDVNEAAMSEIYDGDREALRDVVDTFLAETDGACPEALSVSGFVATARCDPDMVRFLFDGLGLDPNQSSAQGPGLTALFDVTYFDPEDDPEFSQVCTPQQDLDTVRVLLEAGADPCIGPEQEHQYDPALNAPEWDPPAIGISEWGESPEIVELVEGAALNCTP